MAQLRQTSPDLRLGTKLRSNMEVDDDSIREFERARRLSRTWDKRQDYGLKFMRREPVTSSGFCGQGCNADAIATCLLPNLFKTSGFLNLLQICWLSIRGLGALDLVI